MLGNLSFTRKIWSISSLTTCIFSLLNIYFKFTVFYYRGDRQNALQHGLLLFLDMPSRHVETWARRSCFPCQAGSGRSE